MREPGQLPPELESLVIAERNAPTGSASDHRRIRGRLGIGLGVLGVAAAEGSAGGASVSAGAGASAGATAVGGSLAAKLLVLGAALSAAGGGGYLLGRQHEATSAHRPQSVAVEWSTADDARAREPRQVALPAQPAPAPVEAAVTETSTEWARSGPDDDPPPAETALIVAAWQAVERGDSRAAGVAIAAHDEQFPSGALAEERDALRVRSLLAAGDRDEAAERARSFLETFPDSVHAATVQRALRDAGGGR